MYIINIKNLFKNKSFLTQKRKIQMVIQHKETLYVSPMLQANKNIKTNKKPKFLFKNDRYIWITVWWLLKKLNVLLPHDPAFALLGIYPKESKTYVYTKTYTVIFMAALFIIANICKQSRCPSVGEWVNKP